MNANRVLLMQLSERTSAKGSVYLSGWLGKASVVAFRGEPDRWGNETWDLFVSEPPPKTETGQVAPEQRSQEPARDDAGRISISPPATKQSAPVGRGDGWRGSRYVRPRDAQRRDLLPEGEPADDGVDDLYR